MASEFASLSDLAISRGILHSRLISDIHSRVLSVYHSRFPKSPAGVAVVVDEISGDVRLFAGDKDVTPPEFISEAASLARQVIIDSLAGSSSPPAASPARPVRLPSSWGKILANLFFWGYNLYFILFILSYVFSVFGSLRIPSLFSAITAIQIIFSLVMLATPILTMIYVFRSRSYHQPGFLLKLFFLFELPVEIISLISLSSLRDAAGFTFLIVLAFLFIPFLLLTYGRDISRRLQPAALVVNQFVLAVWGYLVILYSFFFPVAAGYVGMTLMGLDNHSYRYLDLAEMFTRFLLGIPVLVIVGTLLLLPYGILIIIVRSFLHTRTQVQKSLSPDRLSRLHLISGIVTLCLFVGVSFQPASRDLITSLIKINTPSSFDTREELAKKLVPQQDRLRHLIKDSSGISGRYPFHEDDTWLKQSYRDIYGLPDAAAGFIQKTFNLVAYPLVFQGPSAGRYELDRAYTYLFGKSAYAADVKAPSATDPKNIYLISRRIDMTPSADGSHSTISIEEEYTNTSFQQQEVIYEFTFPEQAVITALDLGPDLEFPGIIAPKGAAQKVYEQQLQIRRDPALLEQIGPNAYRLRVFPVPAKNDTTTLKGRQQKVRYTYIVTASPDGFALPNFTKQSNIKTDGGTRFILNVGGKTSELKGNESYLPFTGTAFDVCSPPASPSLQGDSFTVTLKPYASLEGGKAVACGSVAEVLASLSGTSLAIFYDVSAGSENTVTAASLFSSLSADPEFVSRNRVDLYRFNNLLSSPMALTPELVKSPPSLPNFGTSDLFTALSGFQGRYDAAFVISASDKSVDLVSNYPFTPATTVFFIHPDRIPAYTNALTGRLIQSKGGSASSFPEALRMFALNKLARGEYEGNAVPAGRYFTVIRTNPGSLFTSIQPLALKTPLSSLLDQGIFALNLSGMPVDPLYNAAVLDSLHSIALRSSLVTPYSSLIALVNDQQKATLDQLQQSYDRYRDRTMVTNPVAPQRMPEFSTSFEGLEAPSIFGGFLGADLKQFNVPSGSMVNPSVDTTGGMEIGNTQFSRIRTWSPFDMLGSGFALFTGAVFVAGFAFFIFRLIRPKNPKS